MDTTVYRVSAILSSGVDAPHPVHLDALLANAWAKRHGPRDGREFARDRDIHCRSTEIPRANIAGLRRVEARGSGLWLCSAWMLEGELHRAPMWYTRRRDAVDQDMAVAPYTPGSGPSRDVLARRERILTRRVSWLGAGSAREAIRGCRLVSAIGSMRRHGAGSVSGWSVERVDLDPLRVLVDENGRATRHIPASWCTYVDGPVSLLTVRAPYFTRRLAEPAVSPGARIELHADVLRAVEVACFGS